MGLFRGAEQRINFVYMLIMTAFESAILIYILSNGWDDTRFFFGIRAGIVLLPGIIVNAVFRKKCYPWIKYFNNIIIMASLFYLCGFTDLIALLFIMLPFINSFYFIKNI